MAEVKPPDDALILQKIREGMAQFLRKMAQNLRKIEMMQKLES